MSIVRVVAAEEAPSPAGDQSAASYVVQPGDTLTAISHWTGVPVAQLVQGNLLPDSDRLPVGLRLRLPGGDGTAASAPGAGPAGAHSPPPLGAHVAAIALRYLGAPYRFGGADPNGFDCSGFVAFVGREAGRPLPRHMAGQYAAGTPVPQAVLQPGDVVFFTDTYTEGLSHSGIYVGSGEFIHAGTEDTGVIVSALANPYWASHWFGAIRMV